ncbi:hypothetical protein [Alkalicoccobacillus plakortidis]|nr:hypothetical protein [Alkalicoccobacillus plakortidis]
MIEPDLFLEKLYEQSKQQTLRSPNDARILLEEKLGHLQHQV